MLADHRLTVQRAERNRRAVRELPGARDQDERIVDQVHTVDARRARRPRGTPAPARHSTRPGRALRRDRSRASATQATGRSRACAPRPEAATSTKRSGRSRPRVCRPSRSGTGRGRATSRRPAPTDRDPDSSTSGAERGQHHRTRAARSVEHLVAEDPFQRSDLLADRRLGVAEPVCGPAERALCRDRVEGDQMTQFEVTQVQHEHQYR